MAILKVKPDTIFKAFVLNALAQAFIVTFAVTLKDALDKVKIELHRVLLVFVITFIASILAFYVLHFTLGFGDAFIVS